MRNYSDTKAGQAANAAFTARVTALLVSMGAEVAAGPRGSLVLQTRAGVLTATPYGDWVAMRFHDVEAARRVLGTDFSGRLNPYSGKFNWQGTNLMFTPVGERKPIEDEVLASIEREIRPLLGNEEPVL